MTVQSIGLYLPSDFDLLSLGPFSVFAAANSFSEQTHYELCAFSAGGGLVRSACGVDVVTRSPTDEILDTMLIGSAASVPQFNRDTVRFLQTTAANGTRIGGLGLGAFLLADAGLLIGRRATTIIEQVSALGDRSAGAQIESEVAVIEDGQVWTCSTLLAGVELALLLVARDLGADMASRISYELWARTLDNGQKTFLSCGRVPRSKRIRKTLEYARENLHNSLSVEQLAAFACLSPRQFSRVFHLEVGHSPARAVEQLRVEAARRLLVQERLPVKLVAEKTGFGGHERMRRAFHRNFGKAPRMFLNWSED